MTCLSMPHCRTQLIRVAGRLGVRLPATPPPLPRPDGGGQPGRVPVYTALKKSTRQRACHQPVQETMPTAEHPQFLHCLDHLRHLSLRNDRHLSNSVQHRRCNCGIWTVFSTSAPENEVQLWDLNRLLHDCTRGTCWNAQPNRRTPCQCTATGETPWSAEQ